ncbi:metallophosphoesterase family protein [Acetivibrio cellulolyticus]|uniref:metallophosphoesterase family protein n=1 Tax=Acetivibrio cellulolyticus TaxID=35830 RepID=UPI0001E30129|nr:metallophosphoesterase family protein [Acetivibrio cellulolyticus]
MRRQVIIGDIHGCYDEVQSLLDKVGLNKDDEIITVGDFLDRGPKSLEVVEFLRNNANFYSIVGNHERKHLNKIYNYAQEITKLKLGQYYEGTINWIKNLPYYYENNDVIVVHAALIPGVKMEKQPQEVLCGSTSGERYLEQILKGKYWYEVYEGDKPVVFGHHCVDNPLIYNDLVYGIDTGACHGGFLTAITVPDFKVYSVKAKEDYWEAEKKKWQKSVVVNRPWKSMKWEQIENEIERFKKCEEEDIKKYANVLELWVKELKNSIPKIVKAIEQITKQILMDYGETGFGEVSKKHILSSFLFTCYHGRLNLDVVSKKCISPEKTLEMAKILDILVAENPEDLS